MTNKEAIEILKESANRNKKSLEIGIDTMSGEVLEWVTKEIEALTKAIELLEAEGEGRLIKLPCKVGDKVKVDSKTWGNLWNLKIQGDYLIGEIISIVKTKKQILMKIQAEHHVSWKRDRRRYPISAIGITVFLTREAAEQSLKGNL